MEYVHVENEGPEITGTNYFDTPNAAQGYYYLSSNAGVFRLLVPDSQVGEIAEWRAAREVIISRGPWRQAGNRDAIEVLFEDGSGSPYAIHLVAEQVDRMPLPTDQDRPGEAPRWRFSAWTRKGKVLELPSRYRIVKSLPWLRKWEE